MPETENTTALLPQDEQLVNAADTVAGKALTEDAVNVGESPAEEVLPEAEPEETAAATEMPAQRVPAKRNDSTVVSVPATITRGAYESIKKYLIPPSVKVVWIVVMVL